jgi:hypothetical protein
MKNMRKSVLAGWVLSVLLALFLGGVSASGKLTAWEGKAEMFAHLGWSEAVIAKIAFLEIGIAILYLIPRTAFVGAILLTGYLGGATATHARVGDPWYFPVLLGVVAWVAFGLRYPGRLSAAIAGPEAARSPAR